MSERARLPPRPAIPMTLWALASSIVGARLVLASFPDADALLLAAGVLVMGAAALSGALCLLGLRTAVPVVVVVLSALGASVGVSALEMGEQLTLASALGSRSVSAWEFELAGDMTSGASGWRGRARALEGGVAAGEVWLLAAESFEAGSRVRCVGRFTANGDDDWGVSSRMQGIAGTVRVVRALEVTPAGGAWGVVLSLRRAVLASLDASSTDGRALVAGSVCGFTPALAERGLDDVFAACGVSHLVAVSGGHLVLVCAMAGSVLDRTRLGPLARASALLVASGAFVAFCGAPASAVRSWAMSVVASLARAAGRRSDSLSSVSLVALLMALLDPGVTGQLGYLLSVTCVCGIGVFGGYARYLVRLCLPSPRLPRAIPERVSSLVRGGFDAASDALALTLVAQAVTLPLTCATFSQLSLVAPLANVLLSAPFALFLSLGLGASLLAALPLLQGPALLACDVVGGLIVGLLRALSSLPLASVAVDVEEGSALALLAVCSCALLLAWPHLTRRAVVMGLLSLAVACGAYVARWRLFAPACVRVLDVGQGDAILVTDGAESLLVDTGPGDAVVEALARSHVLHLDAVVLTHLHDDHVGGLDAVLELVDVGTVVVAEGVVPPCGDGVEVVEVGYGDRMSVGRFELVVVSPLGPVDGSANEHSIELALGFDDGGLSLTGLLTGDAERDETAAALERGDVGDVDFLKVGHHGSEASVDDGVAAALSPEVSVASAGEGNTYGHPSEECVACLERAGSTFLCTMDVGDVCVEPGRDGPVVTCARGWPG